jgi:hypothetical protein
MSIRFVQSLCGLVLIVVGVLAAVAAWANPNFGIPFVRETGAALSALVVLGLALMILPSPREERIRRGDDMWELSGMKLITARWWCVILLALALGGGHFAFVSQGTGLIANTVQAAKN